VFPHSICFFSVATFYVVILEGPVSEDGNRPFMCLRKANDLDCVPRTGLRIRAICVDQAGTEGWDINSLGSGCQMPILPKCRTLA